MGFFKEFKEFAVKGNVLDLAVAVIIGGAFGKIITSMVDDILMPVLGTVMGNDFNKLSSTINGATVKYGIFIQNVVNFISIAFVIFVMIRIINKMKRTEPTPPPVPPSATEALLTEIRDLMRKSN